MAANPIVVVEEGRIDIPAELKDDPRFQNGARLELVPIGGPAEARRGDWRRLDGLLAGEAFDATEWKRQERQRELAHDERKFGTERASW